MKKIKVKKALRLFNEWNKHNRAKATYRSYKSRLQPFGDLFGKRKLKSIGPIEIEQYIIENSVRDNGEMKSPSTRRSEAISIERFQNWCIEHRMMKKPFIKRIEKPRGKRRERLASPEETKKILVTASDEFRLAYLALLHTGMRPMELCQAKVKHIHGNQIVLKKHKTASKTGKPRIIPIGRHFRKLIDQSLDGRDEGFLFIREWGRPWTPESLGRQFRAIREELGLDRELKLYCTRHQHITEVVRKHGIVAGKQSAGHTSTKTTEVYIHETLTDLIEAQESFALGV